MRHLKRFAILFVALYTLFLMWINSILSFEPYNVAEQETTVTSPFQSIHDNLVMKAVPTTQQRQVLITTLPRSGSTFLGEMFRNDPRLVYLFEVTRGYSEAFHYDHCASDIDNVTASQLTQQIFSCDFRELKKFMVNEDESKVFYTWQHAFNYSSSPEQLKICLPPEVEAQDAKLQRLKTSVIIKEITFWAPKANWLLHTFGADFRFLWLVRDVRGFVSSWINWNNASIGLYEEFGYHHQDLWIRYSHCLPIRAGLFSPKHTEHLKELLSNVSYPVHKRMAAYWAIETALSLHYFQKVPKNQLMVVQYERLASYPFEYIQQIYHFLGFNIVPESVLEWIMESTQHGNENVRFGTRREAKKMVTAHKDRLAPEQIKDVEEIAEPLLQYNHEFIT